jgi:hypothetical protein
VRNATHVRSRTGEEILRVSKGSSREEETHCSDTVKSPLLVRLHQARPHHQSAERARKNLADNDRGADEREDGCTAKAELVKKPRSGKETHRSAAEYKSVTIAYAIEVAQSAVRHPRSGRAGRARWRATKWRGAASKLKIKQS